jgi:hypothetical protein
MAKLTYKERQKLPASAFVFPEEEAYPIHDEAHARAALQRGSQHESGSRLAKIVRAVARRYPNIEINPDLLRKARRG